MKANTKNIFLLIAFILTILIVWNFGIILNKIPVYYWLFIYSSVSILIIIFTIFTYFNHFKLFIPLLFHLLVILIFPVYDLIEQLAGFSFAGILYFIPLLIFFLITCFSVRIRSHIDFLIVGDADTKDIILIILLILGSPLALLAWSLLMNPDLGRFIEMFPQWDIDILIAGCIGFSAFNSFIEEFSFRGLTWNGLRYILKNKKMIILIQALLFSLIHIKGFPGGFMGVVMVFVWGTLLGILRNRTHGVFYPVVTHFFADMTIFWILYYVVNFS